VRSQVILELAQNHFDFLDSCVQRLDRLIGSAQIARDPPPPPADETVLLAP
jgi:hypothetical protein